MTTSIACSVYVTHINLKTLKSKRGFGSIVTKCKNCQIKLQLHRQIGGKYEKLIEYGEGGVRVASVRNNRTYRNICGDGNGPFGGTQKIKVRKNL